MLHKIKLLPLVLLLALLVGSCDEDPTGSNGVPNRIEGQVTLVDSDLNVALTDHSGVTVALQGTGFTAQTSAKGDYILSGVPPGIYVMSFSKADFDSLRLTVEYSGVGVEFVPEATLRSHYKVNRIEGAIFKIYPRDTVTDHSGIKVELGSTGLSSITDPSGRYVFHDPPKGSHKISYSSSEFDSAFTELDFRGGIEVVPSKKLYSVVSIQLDALLRYSIGALIQNSYKSLFDSVRSDSVFIAGAGISRTDSLLLVLGKTKNVRFEDLSFNIGFTSFGELAVKSWNGGFVQLHRWSTIRSYFYPKEISSWARMVANAFERSVYSNTLPMPK